MEAGPRGQRCDRSNRRMHTRHMETTPAARTHRSPPQSADPPAVTDHHASLAPQSLAAPGSSRVAGEVLHIHTEIAGQLGDRRRHIPKHHLDVPLLLGDHDEATIVTMCSCC